MIGYCAGWIILMASMAPTMKASYFKPFKKELIDVLTKLDWVEFNQAPRPNVSDAELNWIISELWRDNAKVWNWWTADAIRFEIATGQKVWGKTHIVKWKERMTNLNNRLKKNPTASSNDYNAAADLYNDLENALKWN